MMQYSIGDISRKTGLTVSTLRYYEKLGVLSAVPVSYTHLLPDAAVAGVGDPHGAGAQYDG